MKLLADSSEPIPLMFLITDGAVKDEREVCNEVKNYLGSTRSISPRIYTFGIGKILVSVFFLVQGTF